MTFFCGAFIKTAACSWQSSETSSVPFLLIGQDSETRVGCKALPFAGLPYQTEIYKDLMGPTHNSNFIRPRNEVMLCVGDGDIIAAIRAVACDMIHQLDAIIQYAHTHP